MFRGKRLLQKCVSELTDSFPPSTPVATIMEKLIESETRSSLHFTPPDSSVGGRADGECRITCFPFSFAALKSSQYLLATACRPPSGAAASAKALFAEIKSATVLMLVVTRAKGMARARQIYRLSIRSLMHELHSTGGRTHTRCLLNGEKIASLNITHRQMPAASAGERQELSLCGEDSVNFASSYCFLECEFDSKILRPLIFLPDCFSMASFCLKVY